MCVPYETLVTVILPVHNSRWLAEKAILSAMQANNQTPFKLAIYDDGSDFHTKTLIKQIADRTDQIELHSQDKMWASSKLLIMR